MIKTKAEKTTAKVQQAKKEKDEKEKLRAMFDAVAATEDGRDLFKYLMNSLGHNKNTITMNPTTGEVNTETTNYLTARKEVYLEIRRNISDRHLKKIEFK